MQQYGQVSIFYSITIVLIGMLFLIFSRPIAKLTHGIK